MHCAGGELGNTKLAHLLSGGSFGRGEILGSKDFAGTMPNIITPLTSELASIKERYDNPKTPLGKIAKEGYNLIQDFFSVDAAGFDKATQGDLDPNNFLIQGIVDATVLTKKKKRDLLSLNSSQGNMTTYMLKRNKRKKRYSYGAKVRYHASKLAETKKSRTAVSITTPTATGGTGGPPAVSTGYVRDTDFEFINIEKYDGSANTVAQHTQRFGQEIHLRGTRFEIYVVNKSNAPLIGRITVVWAKQAFEDVPEFIYRSKLSNDAINYNAALAEGLTGMKIMNLSYDRSVVSVGKDFAFTLNGANETADTHMRLFKFWIPWNMRPVRYSGDNANDADFRPHLYLSWENTDQSSFEDGDKLFSYEIQTTTYFTDM